VKSEKWNKSFGRRIHLVNRKELRHRMSCPLYPVSKWAQKYRRRPFPASHLSHGIWASNSGLFQPALYIRLPSANFVQLWQSPLPHAFHPVKVWGLRMESE
jgi:hypothetical protein